MMTMTRRDTFVGAIALLCELGAAEVQARSGITGQPSLGPNEAQPGSGSQVQRVTQAEAHAGSQTGQSAERGGAGLVFKHDLPNIAMDDWEVTVSAVDFPPGRVGKVHHHAGFVLAYVLEGNVVTKVSGQEERTYRPGEMFFEPPGSTHEVSRNASDSQPAKLLALIFAKKGVPLTMPGPA
ncbi:MAG TPA: cupin domain-containing protein [Candidatus Acidoferrum sp.]